MMNDSEDQDIFSKLLELSPVIIIIHGDGIITYVNPYTASLLTGGDRSKMIGQPLSRFVHPDYHDMVTRNLAIRGKSRDTIQYSKQRLISHDGREFYVRGSSTPIIYQGAPSILAIAENVTEANELMAALQNSEEKFRLLVENARDIIYKCTYRGDFVYMNPSGLAMLGYDPETLYRLNYTDLIPPEIRSREYRFYREQLQKQTVETYHEMPILKRDGTVIWFGQHVILTHEKGVSYFYGAARDITELREMRISLERSEKKYRLIAENSNDIIWVLDAETLTFTYISPAILQMRGFTMEEGLRERLPDVFPPEHLKRVLFFIENELEKEKTGLYDPNRSIIFEAEQYTKNGSTIWVEINTRFLRDAEGTLVGVQGSTRNITDRKRLEQERDAYAGHLEDLVDEKTRELSLRVEKNRQEMEAAQQVQRAILPQQPPRSSLVTVAYRYSPMDALGGDFLSFTSFKETDSLGIFIGDVSGHGVEAALYTMMIKAVSDRLLRDHGLDPADFLRVLNQELCKSMQSHFLSAIYGIVSRGDDTAASFTFAKAGHPFPIVYRKESDTVSYVTAPGIALGLFNDIAQSPVAVPLSAGDRIFLYTDGFIEALNEEREIFGFDAFLSLIHDAHRTGRTIEETLDCIAGAIDAFRRGTPQEDDMVLIGIEAQ